MTYRKSERVFGGVGTLIPGIAAIGLAVLVGCATATIEDAVPVAAPQGTDQPASNGSEMAGADANLPATVSATPSGPSTSTEVAEAEPGPTVPTAEVQGTGRNTGAYPNLNIKPGVANSQFTPAQKRAALAELETKRKAQAANGSASRSTINQARLRKLAATNADKVLKEIEGE